MNSTKNVAIPVNVKIEGISESSTKINLRAGNFNLTIDEPANMGGTNEGPSPIQVLLMALAGCLNMTGHTVAKEQDLELIEMKISIEGNMDAAHFMGYTTSKRAGFEDVNVYVETKFDGKPTKEQRDKWLEETERRCPVTDNMKTHTKISINSN
ncbi:MAG: OsmC family peroxiredoxin [Bacteroidetes bacterium]|nr:MAG: OsmC family peroxiredoxin [Bacteroidota bacterium]